MKRIIFAVTAMLVSAASQAQVETTMPFLRGTHQSTYVNPAFIPRYGTSIGVPVLSNNLFGAGVVGVSLADAHDAIENDTVLNLTTIYDNMSADVFGINAFTQTDLFHVRFMIGDYHIGLHSSLRTHHFFELDRNFYGFLSNGNKQYQGQTVEFTGVSINSTIYQEYGVSVAREFKRLSVGARVKFLQGLSNISTDEITASVTTGSNVAEDPIILKLGGKMHVGGPVRVQDSTTTLEYDEDDSDSPSDAILNPFLKGFTNNGISMDLGASYWLTPRLNIYASAVDVGWITWKEGAYTYDYNDKNWSFGGLTYDQASDEEVRTLLIDSIADFFGEGELKEESFTVWLPSRYFAGADYDLTVRDRVGVLLQGQYYNKSLRPAVSLAYSRRIGTNWDVTGNYSYFNGSFTNIGLGTSVKVGAFQIFFAENNILGYMLPASTRGVHLRFGVNLVWNELRRYPRTH